MKIKILIFLLIFVLSASFAVSKKTKEKIDYNSLCVKNLPIYSDELRAKYPDLLNIRWWIPSKRFEIKKNKNTLCGVYDTKEKKLVIPYQYSDITQCQNHYGMFFLVKEKNNEKIIDYKNNTVYQSNKYKLNCTDTRGIITSKYNDKSGFVTFEGKESSKPVYDEISTHTYPTERKAGSIYIFVKKDNLYAVVDENNKTIIPFQDKKLTSMMYFLFKTTDKNNKQGVIDIFGNTIIDNIYDYISFEAPPLTEYYFIVSKDKLCGIINLQGEIEVPCVFKCGQLGRKLSEGRYTVNVESPDENEYRTIHLADENGKILTKRPYYNIYSIPLTNKLFGVLDYNEKDNKTLSGIITKDGKVLIEPEQDIQIHAIIEDKLVIVMKNKKFGIIYNNDFIVPPHFGSINYKKGFLFIESKPIRFDKQDFIDYKVPTQKTNNLHYYVITPDNLIKINGNLEKQKLYKADTYKEIDKDCFKMKYKSGLFFSDYTETIFCNNGI